jgi:hypothetical protein
VSARRGNKAADVALAQQQITVIGEPRSRARYQLGIVEHRGGFAPQIGDEAAPGMLARLRAAERGEGSRLMVKTAAFVTPADALAKSTSFATVPASGEVTVASAFSGRTRGLSGGFDALTR